MKMGVTEFKAKCTQILREVATKGYTVEIANRGKVIAVVSPPPPPVNVNPAWGSMKDTVLHVAEDFDDPLGDEEWEAAR